MDIQGSKRDPVNSEKAWLDFAVRLLSREVVGKGKGQEAVWSERCKPQWWDKKVKLPWKNPTANPKDTKEVLLKKYIALEKHLREDDRFPEELEEEAKLWSEGKYKELFLQTSLVSLLGKVTGVHAAIIDAVSKVGELKAKVSQSLLSGLQQCLSSTLEITGSLTAGDAYINKPTKRASPYIENIESVPEKRRKSEQSNVLLETEEASQHKGPQSFDQSKEMSRTAQKITSTRCSSHATRAVKRCERQLRPKLPNEQSSNTIPKVSQVQGLSLLPLTSSSNIMLSPEELSRLLQGNLIVHSHPAVWNNGSVLPQATLAAVTESGTNTSRVPHENRVQFNHFDVAENNAKSYLAAENEITHASYDSDTSNCQSSHTLAESESMHVGYDSDVSNYQSSHSCHSKWTPAHSEIDFLLSQTEDDSSDDKICSNTPESISSQASFNTSPAINTNSNIFMAREGSLEAINNLEQGQNDSHRGCVTECDVTNHDGICASKEQYKLWEEDGSFLLHRFLDDLDRSANGSMAGSFK